MCLITQYVNEKSLLSRVRETKKIKEPNASNIFNETILLSTFSAKCGNNNSKFIKKKILSKF